MANDTNNASETLTRQRCVEDFDDKYNELILQDNSILTGLLTICLGIWISVTILASKKCRNNRYYINLLNFTIAAVIHRILVVITMWMTRQCYKCLDCSTWGCKIIGFSDMFLNVYKMESLSQACVERYIHAYYTTKGWKIPGWYLILYPIVSLCLATFYSAVMAGMGHFERDFDCLHCILVSPPSTGLNVDIISFVMFLLIHVKPMVAMAVALHYAKHYERLQHNGYMLSSTSGLVAALAIWYWTWTPLMILRTVLGLLKIFINYQMVEPSAVAKLIQICVCLQKISNPLIMMSIMFADRRLRERMVKLIIIRYSGELKKETAAEGVPKND